MAEQQQDNAGQEDPFPSLPKIYANAVKVSRTYHDFQLVLGTSFINSIAEQPSQVVFAQAVVQMSPEHFKSLTRIFNEQLVNYESEFGQIPSPPAVKKSS